MSKVAVAANLSTGPQQQKIIQDVEECVQVLVETFKEYKTPINDDNQTLHRFCAKLEHLLQMDMKEKHSLLGRKKDYWDYFCDCLSSNKGSNEGIKFVKSIGEHKTSIGKGRALLRFSLVHHRLPDSIQQCVINGKVTSDYYFPQSVWLQKEKSSAIIGCLYDLSEVNFDLSSRGYDLDSAWPSFAKKSGSFNWNPPSRRDSFSSLSSVQTADNTSLLNMSIPTFDNHEVDRLNQDLAYSESLQSELKYKVESLQEEKLLSEKSAWVTQGELSAVQNQLADSQQQLANLQDDHRLLEKKYDQLTVEKNQEEKDWKSKIKLLEEGRLKLESDKQTLEGKLNNLEDSMSEMNNRLIDETDGRKRDALQLETSKSEIELNLKSCQQELTSTRESLEKKTEEVKILENKLTSTENHNQDLLKKLENVLEDKGSKASASLEATNKLSEMLTILKQTQTENTDLKAENTQLQIKLSNMEEKHSDVLKHKVDLETNVLHLTQELSENKISNDQKLATLSKQESDVKNQLDELTKQLQSKQSELLNVKKINVSAFNGVISCFDDIGDFSALNPASDDFDSQELLKILKSSKTKLQEQHKSLQAEIQSLKAAKDTQATENTELQQKVAETSKRLDELSLRHEKLTESKQVLDDELKSERMNTSAEIKNLKESLKKSDKIVSEYKTLIQEQEESISQILTTLNVEDTSSLKNNRSLALKKVCEQTSVLASSLSQVKSQCDQLQQQVHLNESGQTEQEAKLSELLRELKTSKDTFKDEIDERNKQIESLSKSVSDLDKSLSEKNGECAILVSNCDKLSNEITELRGKLNTTMAEKSKIESDVQIDKEKLQKQSSIMEKNKTDLENQIKIITSELNEKQTEVEKLQQNFSDCKKELDAMVTEKEEIVKSKQSLHDQIASVQDKLKTALSDLEKEKQVVLDLKKESKEQESSENKLQSDLQELDQLYKSAQCKCEEYESERETLNSRLEDALQDTQSIKGQLQQTSTELEVAYSVKEKMEKENAELQSSVEENVKNINSLNQKYENLKIEADASSKSVEEFRQEKSMLMEELDRLKQELSEAEKSIQKVTEESFSLTSRIELITNQFENQGTELHTAQSEKKELEEQLAEIQTNLESMTNSKLSVDEKYKELSQRCEELDNNSKSSGERESELQNMVDNLKVQLETQSQEISALQFQLGSEQIERDELVQSYSSQLTDQSELRSQLEEQAKQIKDLNSQLDRVKNNDALEFRSQEDQIEIIRQELIKKGDELNLAQQKIALTEDQLEQERVDRFQLKGELDALSRTVSSSSSEKDKIIKDLTSDINQLKKKLIKVIRDKDALWQMTDQLTYEQKQQAGEVWMDNSTVTNCLACKAEFSLWLRRHHCRMCGKIFCHNCCNNWIMTAHSSKKERVCNKCKSKSEALENDCMNSSVLSSQLDSDEENELINSVRLPSTSSQEHLPQSSQESGSSPSCSSLKKTADEEDDKVPHSHSSKEEATVQKTNRELSKEDNFHLITTDEITRSLSFNQDDSMTTSICNDPSVASSVLLIADELERGEVNSQNETCIKPGKIYVVPVKIDTVGSTLFWQFTSKPKDIVFSVKYSHSELTSLEDCESVVEPCKCNSHQKAVEGELTTKEPGIYTLIFDNTYSKLTSKTVHYTLKCSGSL